MRIEVDHSKFYDWAPRHGSQIEPGMVSRAAPDLGPDIHLARTTNDNGGEPGMGTVIIVPDEQIAHMHAMHVQGVKDAAKGGWPHPVSGAPVEPRIVPEKSASMILAEHIQHILAGHNAGSPITDVRVPGYPGFEAFLKARLMAGSSEIDDEVLGASAPSDEELEGAPVKIKPAKEKA